MSVKKKKNISIDSRIIDLYLSYKKVDQEKLRKLTKYGSSVTRSTSMSITNFWDLRRAELTITRVKCFPSHRCLIDSTTLGKKKKGEGVLDAILNFDTRHFALNAIHYRPPLRSICMIVRRHAASRFIAIRMHLDET